MKNLSEAEWAWISGLLEGEACFSITNNYPVFYIQMTDLDIMEKLASYLDATVKGPRARKDRKLTYDIAFRKSSKLQWIYENIYNRMGERRKKALDKWAEVWDAKQLRNATTL